MKKAGWVTSGLFVLFMLGASITPKFLGMQAAADALVPLGWSADFILLIGCLELTATLLYVFPRTALLGAILMTGILGGAMASHIRVGSPLLSHTLFSVYLGLVMWGGLWLRDPRVRAVLPISMG